MANSPRPLAPPDLAPELKPILEAPFPRFSAAEMTRRRNAIAAAMAAADVDHLVIYGANRTGNIIQWMTQWPVLTEAAGVHTPGQRDVLHIQHYNHIAQARRLAEAQVEWGGASAIQGAIAELERRGAARDRVGIIGPLGFRGHAALVQSFGAVKDLNPAYTRARMVKSDEEISWFRLGAYLSDLGIAALEREARPGLTERELGAIIEAAWLPYGAVNVIHFLGVTPMETPDLCVPAQYPSSRRVAQGDVITTEISGQFWDHSGQVLRSFAVGREPTPLYRDLHAAADAAFDAMFAAVRPGAKPADLIAAARVIEEAGFTTNDDIVHGYGGGYFPPVLGSASRPAAGPVPDFPLAPGMMMVIQPNVITRDNKAGVQTGELVLVTDKGAMRMHNFPRGFRRIG
ncbi:MAG TPA: M24 family metallopeptidase [Stellaceae bacterium]|nr:M24 family metallopeptidase [Stellaceae bacterium]